VRELRGIGPSIEARLLELVETGDIAELAELERELAPGLVGLGRYLGLGAKRSVEIARALGVRTADELREAAAPAGCGPRRASGRRPRRGCSRRSPAGPPRSTG
jgi:DNA polymerase (family 10)